MHIEKHLIVVPAKTYRRDATIHDPANQRTLYRMRDRTGHGPDIHVAYSHAGITPMLAEEWLAAARAVLDSTPKDNRITLDGVTVEDQIDGRTWKLVLQDRPESSIRAVVFAGQSAEPVADGVWTAPGPNGRLTIQSGSVPERVINHLSNQTREAVMDRLLRRKP